ncbi:hypothetical protein L291_0513 [Acinetobacter guillouiae MSP4-18]|uniref:hypothetical protein n=1 Tax=Acinetobacter guillouiae TaxID=106649 RepID=UPI0003547673|nr:hypothetical protein [Acinetobacter guillouiae]EPH37309.1 hypothetical protein L291_0513 [Acinetobacter guillouiae MSP4-18]
MIIQNEWSYKIAHFKKCDSIENMTQLKMTSTIATQPSGISQQQKGTTKKATTENNTQGSNHNESIGTGRKRQTANS